MQAQEYAMVKWAVGLRLRTTNDAAIESAFNAGRILRTHVLRPTWHFIAPSDIRWMLTLTAPHVRRAMAYMDRQLEVERSFIARSQKAFTKALQGGQPRFRTDLQLALTRAKVAVSGLRLAHLLMHAELDGLICSGPRRERQFTYMLLDERAPSTKPLQRDVALAELTRRYFKSHGPATVQDFSWWSGLSMRDAREGIGMLGAELSTDQLNGRTLVRSAKSSATSGRLDFTCLLPDYDEYGIAYKDRTALFTAGDSLGAVAYNRMIVIDGQIAGSWKRTEDQRNLVVQAVLHAPLKPKKQRALEEAAQRYGEFLEKPVRVVSTIQ